jgi:hypothetical protein
MFENREKMKKSKFVVCLLFILVVGCTPISPPTPPNVMASLTVNSTTATVVPTSATPTESPTATEIPPTATATELPLTATPEITVTPDFTDFVNFVPLPAKVNEANWNGVNFKFVLLEVSSVKRGLVPELPDQVHPKKIEAANIYFLTDQKDIFNKVIVSSRTYLKVTFSNGEKEVVYEGTLRSLMLSLKSRGWTGSRPASPIGKVQFYFSIPEKGMELVELKIAESSNLVNKAVTIYQK